jgi:membrane-associated phospholipid phosphatase
MTQIWQNIRQTLVPLRRRAQLVLVALALVALITPRQVERYGDNYQIALPVLALGCEAQNGQALAYAGRYAVMFIGLHGTKRGLGDAAIAQRPRGGLEGFPSGHTATAAFGAARLVQSCLTGAPVAQAAVILAGAFTGTSRVAVGAHDIWQVLFGGIWGLICAMALRPDSPPRAWLAQRWARLRGAQGRR